ncbi:MAG TPA: DUF2339 domain-containing protein, partial [Methylothermaceae bacterium]|nr:DUF2339 domain-containing protein [Methylothermaceae bacterium]
MIRPKDIHLGPAFLKKGDFPMTKTQPKQASSMWPWAFGLGFLAGVIGAAIASEDWVFWLLAPPGFVIGLLIALVRRTARLQREIDLLKRQLAELQEKTAASAASEKPPPPATAVSSTEEATSPALVPSPAPPISKEPGPPITPPETPPPQPDPWLSSSPAPAPSNPAFEALFQKVIAFFTGDNAVVRIGLLVLFFGVAFLYRYWVERHGIRIELRLILTTLMALAALGWGWRLRRRRPGYALLIQGGAMGVLYITVFAAAKFYQLLPLPLALLLMVALVLLSALLALLQDSMALAVAGTVGGFLAPILTSTGGGSHIQLFSFYALLDLGILAIAWFKAWRPLNLVGFFFTLGIGAVWGRRFYQPEYFATTEPFLILFFLIFSTTAILYAKRQPPERLGYVDSTLIFGTPLAAFTLQWPLVKTLPFGPALSALALAFYYTLLARWLWRQTRETPAFRLLTEAFVALAAAFATLAVPLALSGRWTSVAWVLEGAALVWVGLRQGRQISTAAGVVLQLLAGAAFFLGDLRLVAGHWLAPSQASSPPWLDSTWLGAALIGVTGLFSGWLLHREDKPLWEWVSTAKWLLLGWGVIWWLGSGLHEIERVFQPATQPAMMLLWLAVSLAAFRWIGQLTGWPALAHTHLALLAVLGLAALGDPEFHHHPLAHGGWLAWPVAWGLWYHGLKCLEAGGLKPYPLLHQTGIWLLLFLMARELAWQVDHLLQGQGVWSLLPWAIVPMIALWLLGIRRPGQGWPFVSVPKAYHQQGLLPVAGWLWLWILLSAIASSGHPDPLP